MDAQDTIFSTNYMINIGGELMDLSTPKVMGILNLTPDSFYDGGKHQESYLKQVEKMLEEGTDIIDIGTYSSRPEAKYISEEEELNRLINPLKEICKRFPNIPISIDTFRSKVAEEGLIHGAKLINDISAWDLDENMPQVIKKYQVPYIIMHMQGNPQNMQNKPDYQNVVQEILFYLSKKINYLNEIGINDIIVDVGFGFGKSIKHNYELLKKLDLFKILNVPMLAGLSRKSMIHKLLNTSSEEALNGTTAVNMVALQNGARILRVHDVKEAKQTIELFKMLN